MHKTKLPPQKTTAPERHRVLRSRTAAPPSALYRLAAPLSAMLGRLPATVNEMSKGLTASVTHLERSIEYGIPRTTVASTSTRSPGAAVPAANSTGAYRHEVPAQPPA